MYKGSNGLTGDIAFVHISQQPVRSFLYGNNY
jgi:hypothetical protein